MEKSYILCAVVLMSMVLAFPAWAGAKGPGEAAHVENEGRSEGEAAVEVGQDAAKVLHLHAAPAQVDGRGVVKALRRLTEQQGQPALQQKPLFALGTHPIPSHPAVLPAARCYIYMDAEG